MAPASVGRRPKSSGRPKGNIKSLKRKRDIEDYETLQKAVEELVSNPSFPSANTHSQFSGH
jgi:ATP-dependent RNA helicase DDX10/DBP4